MVNEFHRGPMYIYFAIQLYQYLPNCKWEEFNLEVKSLKILIKHYVAKNNCGPRLLTVTFLFK